jgi:hypothetical protein
MASGAKGLESWRATRLFEAAGGADAAAASAAKGSAGLWTGIAAGTVVMAGAAGAYQVMRPGEAAGARVVIAEAAGGAGTGGASAGGFASVGVAGGPGTPGSTSAGTGESPPDRTADPAAAKLAAAASSAGNILGDVSAWYRGRRVRLTGIVMAEAGTMLTGAEAVRRADGSRPDSVVVTWPRGGRHRALPGATADGLGVITLQGWTGQWLGSAAHGDASSTPAWVAVVGFDREQPAAVVMAAEAAAARVTGGVEVRGASSRLLPGAPLVDARGYVVGIWTGQTTAVALADALRLAAR